MALVQRLEVSEAGMTVTRPALRYHGGKFRLAPWIIGFFPKHQVYAGAAGK